MLLQCTSDLFQECAFLCKFCQFSLPMIWWQLESYLSSQSVWCVHCTYQLIIWWVIISVNYTLLVLMTMLSLTFETAATFFSTTEYINKYLWLLFLCCWLQLAYTLVHSYVKHAQPPDKVNWFWRHKITVCGQCTVVVQYLHTHADLEKQGHRPFIVICRLCQ